MVAVPDWNSKLTAEKSIWPNRGKGSSRADLNANSKLYTQIRVSFRPAQIGLAALILDNLGQVMCFP